MVKTWLVEHHGAPIDLHVLFFLPGIPGIGSSVRLCKVDFANLELTWVNPL